jgi:predicted nucleotidyltransferase
VALLDRAREVNRDARFLVGVKRIRVFGSYTTGAPDLADIDPVVELERKDPDQQRFEALRNERARADGRVVRDFLDELGWPEDDVKKFLRPYLSLHGAHDTRLLTLRRRRSSSTRRNQPHQTGRALGRGNAGRRSDARRSSGPAR